MKAPIANPAASELQAGKPPDSPSQRRTWIGLLQIIALLLVAGLFSLLIWRVIDSGRGSRLVADVRADRKPPAPAFDLPVFWAHTETWPTDLRGAISDGRLAPSELRGHAAVINFWASWCIPCKAEAPRLTASARAHAGRVAFVGIDVQDLETDARRFLEQFSTDYVSVRDQGGATYADYGLTGVPETYYLDRRGRIVAHALGEVSRPELEQGIRLALARGGG